MYKMYSQMHTHTHTHTHTQRILLAIRDVCIDWLDGKERNDDPALRGDKDPKTGFHLEVPRRIVGLSSTQVGYHPTPRAP